MRLYVIGYEPHPFTEAERSQLLASVDACIVGAQYAQNSYYPIGARFYFEGQAVEVVGHEAHGKILLVVACEPN